MRYGTTNLAEDASITITGIGAITGSTSNLVTTKTRQRVIATQNASVVTINVALASSETIDLVAFVGYTGISSDITVTLLDSSVQQAQLTMTEKVPLQQQYAFARFDSETADEITITFDTPSETGEFEIGYLFAGPLSATLKPEAYQIGIVSADPFSTDRGGGAVTSTTFLVQEVDITTQKQTLETVRSYFATLFATGYGTPRVWYFDDGTWPLETMFAVLDADSVRIDPFYISGGSLKANTTLGLREVF
jgi:hypothetical protein